MRRLLKALSIAEVLAWFCGFQSLSILLQVEMCEGHAGLQGLILRLMFCCFLEAGQSRLQMLLGLKKVAGSCSKNQQLSKEGSAADEQPAVILLIQACLAYWQAPQMSPPCQDTMASRRWTSACEMGKLSSIFSHSSQAMQMNKACASCSIRVASWLRRLASPSMLLVCSARCCQQGSRHSFLARCLQVATWGQQVGQQK